MRIKNAFAALLLLAAGCAGNLPDVATHYDRMSGLRTDLITENLLEAGERPRELVWLNAARVFRSQDDFEYYLEVHYEARAETGFLDIPPGDTLILVADGRELRFRGNGSLNRRHEENGLVGEDALYLVSANQLRAIAYANEVQVKIVGNNGLIIRDFNSENFEKFRQFVNRYVEGHDR